MERYVLEHGRLVRRVARRDGPDTITDLGPGRAGLADPHREADRRLLCPRTVPDWSSAGGPAVRIVDLFSGCGSLSLGVLEVARALGRAGRIELAVDLERAPLNVLVASLKAAAAVRQHDLAAALDGCLGDAETESERLMLRDVQGGLNVCVAWPPCQGH